MGSKQQYQKKKNKRMPYQMEKKNASPSKQKKESYTQYISFAFYNSRGIAFNQKPHRFFFTFSFSCWLQNYLTNRLAHNLPTKS
jgi:hypothetical protein